MSAPRVVKWALLVAALSAGCGGPGADGSGQSPDPVAPGPRRDEAPVVAITPEAAASFHGIARDQRKAGRYYLRVRVVPGGCCGYLHKLDLDLDTSPEDHVFESGGVTVAVLKRQVEMLRGARVDHAREGNEVGFKVQNPNFEGESAKKWLAVLKAQPLAE